MPATSAITTPELFENVSLGPTSYVIYLGQFSKPEKELGEDKHWRQKDVVHHWFGLPFDQITTCGHNDRYYNLGSNLSMGVSASLPPVALAKDIAEHFKEKGLVLPDQYNCMWTAPGFMDSAEPWVVDFNRITNYTVKVYDLPSHVGIACSASSHHSLYPAFALTDEKMAELMERVAREKASR